MSIVINMDSVRRLLANMEDKQHRFAAKQAINIIAKEVLDKEHQAIASTFDRPTPLIARGLRVSDWATKESLAAKMWFRDAVRQLAVEEALTPHIPGFSNARRPKRSEQWLRRKGMLKVGEWLIPSRTMPLDQYGNVRGYVMQKMLADIGAYQGAPGFDGTTDPNKARYVFGTVNGTTGPVKGIWWVQGGARNQDTGRWKLRMIAVKKVPLYQKRLDFYGIAEQHTNANLPRVFVEELVKALATAR